MSLEFNKLFPQVEKMGRMIQHIDFDVSDKLALARERYAAASDLDAIRHKISVVRSPEVSGYRGAAPLDGDSAEQVNYIYPAPTPPDVATLVAADGSQVYPNEQALVHYYLLNVGMFTYFHGQDSTPLTFTQPTLAYHKDLVHDANKLIITNRTVDARRTVAEMRLLAEHAWELHRQGVRDPLITLYDNHLLYWAGTDVSGAAQIQKDYRSALGQLKNADAILGGYVDSPRRSRVVLRLLYLNSLEDDAEIIASQNQLATGGDLEGLRDVDLFDDVLEPGERSAIMVQNSPRNLDYRRTDPELEIAFFYVKVFNGYQTALARIDIPMWVARHRAAVDALHSMILSQCQMQGRTPYPYALTRADELAVVTGKDKAKLEELIKMELRKQGLQPTALPPKAESKRAARSDKRAYQQSR